MIIDKLFSALFPNDSCLEGGCNAGYLKVDETKQSDMRRREAIRKETQQLNVESSGLLGEFSTKLFLGNFLGGLEVCQN